MKNKVFVIGDVHGQITMFKEILEYWKPDEEQLILIGDLGDRGEDPKACFLLAKELVDTEGAVCLRGNHEEMLLNFLNRPQYAAANYKMNGGMVTIQSFLKLEEGKYDAVELAASLQSEAPWLKPFIESLPFIYEWENYVFVHAGVDLTLKDWRDSTERDYVWIREGFYDQPNKTDKTFVFGHTVTAMLNEKQTNTDIWDSGDGKIGIDGGAVYGGVIHGVVFDKDGIVDHYEVENKGYAFSNYLRKKDS
ncbi:metallophosphoesterase [Alkalibacterium kapii]|uniref:Serine/threonine protein phosphatase n=1 Tax=Alkalibacterium kapii TaxID=426704 RepID=A0A511ATP5_9LACT|nr:metallophosphoesterase [Alkalibacterium kapii]GEK90451.1 serine/threonine protein phosphatase [Alkalibacterium kapii]